MLTDSQKKTLRDTLPRRLRQNYDSIKSTRTVSTGTLYPDEISVIQQLINDSQPQSPEEENYRTMVQLLYRANQKKFYSLIVSSGLHHLVLWTEAKRMSYHFSLNNLIYVHWNGTNYECSTHSNYGKVTHPDTESLHSLSPKEKKVSQAQVFKTFFSDVTNVENVVSV